MFHSQGDMIIKNPITITVCINYTHICPFLFAVSMNNMLSPLYVPLIDSGQWMCINSCHASKQEHKSNARGKNHLVSPRTIPLPLLFHRYDGQWQKPDSVHTHISCRPTIWFLPAVKSYFHETFSGDFGSRTRGNIIKKGRGNWNCV